MRWLAAIILVLASVTAVAAADFSADSSFPANPAVGTGRFGFDLEMQVSLRATGVNGTVTVYVNSRDGSMALANPHTSLWALGMQDIPDLQIHQVISRTGEILVCGVHPKAGKGCLTLAGNSSLLWASVRNNMVGHDARTFFTTVGSTNQSDVPCCQPGTEGAAHMAGRGRSGELLVFWFDPGRATVRTKRPFLGPGVGVMKDQLSHTNRIVRHFWVKPPEGESPVSSVMMHLDRFKQARHTVDIADYPLVTAFSAPAIGDAANISDWMRMRGADIQQLSRQMANCEQGAAGNDCRTHYRQRIKTIEASIKERVLGFGRQHGLPVPAE